MVPKACRVIPKFHGEGIGRLVKEADVSIIQKFQGSRDGGFQGFKARGLEGERAPSFSQIQRFKRSQRPIESFHVSWEGIGRLVLSAPQAATLRLWVP